MERFTRLNIGAILKNLRRVAPHPWIAGKLLALELERPWLDLLNPRARAGQGGKIRLLSLRPTDLCNLRCRTCGQWGDRGFQRGRDLKALKAGEVSLQRYLVLLEDLVRHGHRPLLNIWGGEPLLYKGLVDLVEAAAALRLPAVLVTNGTTGLVSAAPRLAKAPLFALHISMDAHNADLHRRLRPGVAGRDGFARIQASLAAVHEARRSRGSGLPLITVNTVISRDNLPHLVDLYEAFRGQVDLFSFFLSWWITPERAQAHERDFHRRFGFVPTCHRGWLSDLLPEDYDLLDRQLRELLRRSRALAAPAVNILPPLSGREALETYYTRHQETFGYRRCFAIHQEAAVTSSGDVTPCRDFTDYVVGNVKEATITELWNSPAYVNFRKSLETRGLMPACSRCCGLMAY